MLLCTTYLQCSDLDNALQCPSLYTEDNINCGRLEKSLAVGGGATGSGGTRGGGATGLSARVEGGFLTERENVRAAVFVVSETPSDEVLGVGGETRSSSHFSVASTPTFQLPRQQTVSSSLSQFSNRCGKSSTKDFTFVSPLTRGLAGKETSVACRIVFCSRMEAWERLCPNGCACVCVCVCVCEQEIENSECVVKKAEW